MPSTFIPACGWYALIGISHEEGDEPSAEVREVIAWECHAEKGTERFEGEAAGLVMDADQRYVISAPYLKLENDGEWLIKYTRFADEAATEAGAKLIAESYETEVKCSRLRLEHEEKEARKAARRGGL